MEYPNVCALCEEGGFKPAGGIPAEVFIKLADYYNVSVDYLMGRTKNPKKE